MYHIGVVTSNPATDRTSAQLLSVRHPRARLSMLDAGRLAFCAERGMEWACGGGPIPRWDALIVRRLNAKGSVQAQYELLELLERQGVAMINRLSALTVTESKLQTTAVLASAQLPVPRTMAVQDVDAARDAVRDLGSAVLKPIYGQLGEGLERVDESVSPDWLAEQLEVHGILYLQQFVPTDGTDVRAFVVGGEVVAAMRRIAPPGEWRANVAQGARGEAVELDAQAAALAVEAARLMEMDYAGVDLIQGPQGPLVVELNGCPGWLELQSVTRCDVAGAIVAQTVRRLDGVT